MADITKASALRPLPGYVAQRFDAGGTVYAGDAVYVAADGDVERADADAGSLQAGAVGIVVAGNDDGTVWTDGDPVDVVVFGPIEGWSSMTPGLHLFVSVNAGQMLQTTPDAGSYVMEMGWAKTASTIFVNPSYHTPYVVKS